MGPIESYEIFTTKIVLTIQDVCAKPQDHAKLAFIIIWIISLNPFYSSLITAHATLSQSTTIN